LQTIIQKRLSEKDKKEKEASPSPSKGRGEQAAVNDSSLSPSLPGGEGSTKSPLMIANETLIGTLMISLSMLKY